MADTMKTQFPRTSFSTERSIFIEIAVYAHHPPYCIAFYNNTGFCIC